MDGVEHPLWVWTAKQIAGEPLFFLPPTVRRVDLSIFWWINSVWIPGWMKMEFAPATVKNLNVYRCHLCPTLRNINFQWQSRSLDQILYSLSYGMLHPLHFPGSSLYVTTLDFWIVRVPLFSTSHSLFLNTVHFPSRINSSFVL